MQGFEHVKGYAGSVMSKPNGCSEDDSTNRSDRSDSVGLSSAWGIEPAGTEV